MKPTRRADIEKTFSRIRHILDEERKKLQSVPHIKVDPVIKNITEYLQRNCCEKITLESAAEEVFMNASYFSTYFKQKTGVSFKAYLTSLRVEKAKELLRDTKLKTYDIAGLVGYDDFRYFCKLFKTVTGTTTVEYRRQEHGVEEHNNA